MEFKLLLVWLVVGEPVSVERLVFSVVRVCRSAAELASDMGNKSVKFVIT